MRFGLPDLPKGETLYSFGHPAWFSYSGMNVVSDKKEGNQGETNFHDNTDFAPTGLAGNHRKISEVRFQLPLF